VQDQNLEGRRLGKYRLTSLLGKGGMAEVYLAMHEMLESQVAVKVLPPDLAQDYQMVERFLREARAAASLRHPNIIRIHDVGQDNGVNYFAMDYVEGATLSTLIASKGVLPEQETVRLSRQVISALSDAHRAGIIHRDIKPDNVLIDTRGDAVVMDFGIAKASANTRFTQVGTFMGTVHYSSPEQARGMDVDASSDLYSWGIVMYEMATGSTPFKGEDTAAVFYQHVHEPPVPPDQVNPSVSPGLSEFILKLLEKEPQKRPQSAEDALRILNHLVGHPTRPPKSTPRVETRALALLNEAYAQLKKGQWAAATALADKALSMDPESEKAREVLRQAKQEQDRDSKIFQLTAEAQACFTEGLFSQAARVISELVGVARDKKAALAWLEEAQAQSADLSEIEALLQKGRAFEAAGEFQKAESAYSDFRKTKGDHPLIVQAHNRLTNLQEDQTQVFELGSSAQNSKRLPSREISPAGLDDISVSPSYTLHEEPEVFSSSHEQEEPSPSRTVALDQAGNGADGAEEPSPAAWGGPQSRPLKKRGRLLYLILLLVFIVGVSAVGTYWWLSYRPESRPDIGGQNKTAAVPEPVKQIPRPSETEPAKPPKEPRQEAAQLLAQAKESLKAGNLDQAEKQFQAVISLDSANQPARQGIFEIAQKRKSIILGQVMNKVKEADELLGKGDFGAAESLYKEALAQRPGYAPAENGLQRVSARKNALAQQQKKQLENKKVQHQVEEAVRAGEEYLANDELDQAEDSFKRALGLKKGHALAEKGLQRVLARRKVLEKLKQQEIIRAEALAKTEQFVRQGNAYLSKGNLDLASESYKNAIDITPGYASATEGLSRVLRQRQAQEAIRREKELRFESFLSAVDEFMSQGRLDEAENVLEKASRLKPGLPVISEKRAVLAKARTRIRQEREQKARAGELVIQGEDALKAEDPQKALLAFQEALAADPGNQNAQKGVAKAKELGQELKKLEALALERARKRAALNKALKNGNAYLESGFPNQAKKEFVKALELDSGNKAAQKGLKQAEAGLKVRAEKDKSLASKSESEAGPAGSLQDKNKGSQTYSKKTANVSNELRREANLAFTQGSDFFNAGRYSEAAREFDKYLKVFPDDRTARKNLADAKRMAHEVRYGTLIVSCTPQAEVYVDGRKKGSTPLTLREVEVGRRKVEVRALGGRSHKMVNIKSRTETRVPFSLHGGAVEIKSSSRAQVYFQGQNMGPTPFVMSNLPLGEQVFTLRLAGGRELKRKVTLRADMVVQIKGD
jgi:serine/threonine protein kinase